MNTKQIHKLGIELGIRSDFRGREGVQRFLDTKKKEIDPEALENPYMDSQIHNIAEDKEIKKVLVGIDIDPAELLISKQLGGIDLVIAHHPLGKGLANLADVMSLQCDVLSFYGVPINIAEGLMKERISEVARGVNSPNHQRTPDAARLLNINLMNIHTPADNLAAKFLKMEIDEKNPQTVEEIIKLLKEIPEYKEAMKIGVGPKVFVGAEENRAGKIALSEITGGTEGSPKLYEKMAQAGIGTIIGMHISEEHKKEAEAAHLNVVIAGHISSDSLGMNLFLDELEKQGIEIIPCSGFTRFSRVDKSNNKILE